MNEERDEERQERPRPRVVDKRVTAGDASSGPETEDAAPEAAPPGDSPAADTASEASAGGGVQGPSARPEAGPGAAPGPEAEGVWTPEEEAEARRMAEEMARIPALDWVANSAVTLVNVAATKLDRGDLGEARLAIDALAALISGLGDRLGDIHGPLRQTLAQLQMAYSQRATPPQSSGG